MEIVFLLAPILAFVLIRGALDQRGRERARKLQVLEEAMKNPSLERGTVESLAYQLTGNPTPAMQRERKTGFGMAFMLALGWLTLFTGIGLAALGGLLDGEEATAAGILVGIIGFGLVTYPFALRELESRRPAQ